MDDNFNPNPNHPLLERYARKRDPQLLKPLRKEFRVILNVQALQSITDAIYVRENCNLLVFGVGNDSGLWMAANRNGGKTVFLENHEGWLETVKKRYPAIDARIVSYKTELRDWRKLLNRPEDLMMDDLDDEVRNTNWDVILVDAPMGFKPHHPGRMQSIYTARQLAKENSHVYIDDCLRPVEWIYSNRFFGDTQLVERLGLFKSVWHYRVPEA
ncbi:MAG: hypothetical protein AAF585_26680 [Verrucomicrobiota bacterium]